MLVCHAVLKLLLEARLLWVCRQQAITILGDLLKEVKRGNSLLEGMAKDIKVLSEHTVSKVLI